jgi:hypothetical protein
MAAFSKPVRPSEADPCLAGLLKKILFGRRQGKGHILRAVNLCGAGLLARTCF